MSKIAIDYRNTDAKPEVCKLLDEWIASPKKGKIGNPVRACCVRRFRGRF